LYNRPSEGWEQQKSTFYWGGSIRMGEIHIKRADIGNSRNYKLNCICWETILLHSYQKKRELATSSDGSI
jgi:hypothetical protein